MMASVTLNFDLIDLLHRVESDRQRRVAFTPLLRDDTVKREFGERAIDRIIERMNEGIDKRGASFHKYSKAYINSLAFQAYNKSAEDVNLELTGDMKASMAVKKTTQTGVVIGFDDKEQESKAKAHINGVAKRRLPKRDFWGLPDKDQKEIMISVLSDLNIVEDINNG